MGKKATRRKANKKAIVILFAILCFAIAGVVLGVTYWPAKPADISMSFQSYLNEAVYDSESDMKKAEGQIEEFRLAFRNEFINHEMTDYAYEMDSLDNLISSVNAMSRFYDTNFESIFSDKIAKRDAKRLDGYLNDIKLNIKKIGEHIKNHKEEMFIESSGTKKVNITVVTAVWEAVRNNFESIVTNCVEMTDLLKQFNSMKLKGSFGNQMYCNVVEATNSYFKVIKEKFFNTEGFADTIVGKNASEKLLNFVVHYFYSSQSSISHYYIDESIQKNADNLKLLEEKTEGKVNYEYLILNGFKYDSVSLSAEQITYVTLAVDFLKGGL